MVLLSWWSGKRKCCLVSFLSWVCLQVDRHLSESWAESAVVKGRWEVMIYASALECACYECIYTCIYYICICTPCTYMYMCVQMGAYTHLYMHTHRFYNVWLWREAEDKDSLKPLPCRKKRNNYIKKIWEQKVLTKARMFFFLKWRSPTGQIISNYPLSITSSIYPSSVCLHGGISTDTGCHGNSKQLVWPCSLG